MSDPGLQAIADEIEGMSPGDQLRLAAGLVDRRIFSTARILVDRIAAELAIVERAAASLTKAVPTGSEAK